LVTDAIQPQSGLDKDKASYLRRMMVNQFAETMQAVRELGIRRISFDQRHNPMEKSYKLVDPRLEHRGRYPRMVSFTGKEFSEINVSFVPITKSFSLKYRQLDSLHFFPARIGEKRTSFLAEFRLERSRPCSDEWRLMLDVGIQNIFWNWLSNGKYLPESGAHESLTDQFFGENRHHINLAILIGDTPGQYDIDSIIKAFVTELGLSRLMTSEI